MRLLPLVASVATLTSLLLAPQSASAFDFSFLLSDSAGGSVEGIIRDLEEGFNSPASVEVTKSTIGGTGIYSRVGPGGFTVSSGSITSFDWLGFGGSPGQTITSNGSVIEINWLVFSKLLGSSSLNMVQWGMGGVGLRASMPSSSRSTVAGDPFFKLVPGTAPDGEVSSVPGPLPLFGAAAAFGFSRKLRKRVHASRSLTSTQPTA